MYLKTSADGYVVDSDTKAVINTNNSEYEQIVTRRKQLLAFNQLQQEVNELRAEISVIKQQLAGLQSNG